MLSLKAEVINKRVYQNDILSLLIRPQKIVYYDLLTAQIIGIIECNEGEMKFLESIPVVLKVKDTLYSDLKVSIFLPYDIPPSYASENYKISYFFVINSLNQVFYRLEFFVYKTLSDPINYTSVKIIEQEYYCIEEIAKSGFGNEGLNKASSLCTLQGASKDATSNSIDNITVNSNNGIGSTKSQGSCTLQGASEDTTSDGINNTKLELIDGIGSTKSQGSYTVQGGSKDATSNSKYSTKSESADDTNSTGLQGSCTVQGGSEDLSDSIDNITVKSNEEGNVSHNEGNSETPKDACDNAGQIDAKTQCKYRESIESADLGNEAIKYSIEDRCKYNAFENVKSEEYLVSGILKAQNTGFNTKEQYFRNLFYEHTKDIKFTKDQTVYDKLNLLDQRLKAAKHIQDIPYFKYMNNLEKYKKKVTLHIDQNTRLFSVKQDDDIFFEVCVSNKFETNKNNEFSMKYYQNVSKTKVILKRVEKRKGFGLDLEHVMLEKIYNTSFCTYKVFSVPIDKIPYHTVNCFYFSATFLLVIELDDREIELPINIDQCAKTV